MSILLFRDLRQVDYSTALCLQERLVEARQRREVADILLFVEHPHVFTIGRSGKESNLLCPGEVPVHRAGRGGDVTYHGPGQLIVYPILDLRSKLRKVVHRYLRNLEMTAIRTLKSFGLRAERKPPWTGIWIENRKVASVGVAVKKGVTYHGLALNVNPDLSYFKRIIPCGLGFAEVTSIRKELGREIPLEQVKEEFLRQFVKRFGYSEIRELCLEDIQIGSRSNFQEALTTFASNEF